MPIQDGQKRANGAGEGRPTGWPASLESPDAGVLGGRADSGEVPNIEPGGRVLLDPDGLGKRFWTEFIGLVKGKYLLLRLPMQVGIREALEVDAPVTVRYIQGGCRVCGFKTSVAGMNFKPFPLLFLHHPDRVESLSLRRHERVACSLPGRVFQEGQEWEGMIVNISQGGCRMVLDGGNGASGGTPQADEEIFCSIRLLDSDEELYVRGMVRTVDAKAGNTVLGIQFVEPTEEQAGRIGEYVEGIREYLAV
jgi:hypothetical protein